jgi:hypothetical protein
MTYCPLVKHQNCTTEMPQNQEQVSKIAIMVVTLVRKSSEKSNADVEREMLAGLRAAEIPWMQSVDKVTVLDS